MSSLWRSITQSSEKKDTAKKLGIAQDGFRRKKLGDQFQVLMNDAKALGYNNLEDAKEDLLDAARTLSRKRLKAVQNALNDVKNASSDVVSAWSLDLDQGAEAANLDQQEETTKAGSETTEKKKESHLKSTDEQARSSGSSPGSNSKNLQEESMKDRDQRASENQKKRRDTSSEVEEEEGESDSEESDTADNVLLVETRGAEAGVGSVESESQFSVTTDQDLREVSEDIERMRKKYGAIETSEQQESEVSTGFTFSMADTVPVQRGLTEGWQERGATAAMEGMNEAKVRTTMAVDNVTSAMGDNPELKAAVAGNLEYRGGNTSISSEVLLQGVRSMCKMLMYDGFDTKEFRAMYQEKFGFASLIKHLTAYVFLGGNFSGRSEKVKQKSYGQSLTKELTDNGFIAKRVSGKSLTLPRVAQAYFPVLFTLRSAMLKDGNLPNSVVVTTTPLLLRDMAFSGCLSVLPAARHYQYVMAAFLYDWDKKNPRGTTKPKDMIEETDKWIAVASDGVQNDKLLFMSMARMDKVKLEEWASIFGFTNEEDEESVFKQELRLQD